MVASSQNFQALIDRIYDLIVEGQGSVRVIPSAFFQAGEVIGGNSRSSVPLERARKIASGAPIVVFDDGTTMPQPEISYVWKAENKNRLTRNFTAFIWDLTFDFEIGFKIPSSLWTTKRQEVEKVIWDTASVVHGALSKPGNFRASDGTTTGLASECLTHQTNGIPKYDYPNGVVILPMTFTGIITRDYKTT